jgi:hypothetical protein
LYLIDHIKCEIEPTKFLINKERDLSTFFEINTKLKDPIKKILKRPYWKGLKNQQTFFDFTKSYQTDKKNKNKFEIESNKSDKKIKKLTQEEYDIYLINKN